MGYRNRVQATEQFAWDLAGFYHDFDNVLSSTSLPPILPPFAPEGGVVLPRLFENNGVARAYGFEFSSSWQVTEAWRMFGSYSFLRAEADGTPAPTDARNQFYAQSSWDVTTDLQLDSILRYVDKQYGASSYTAMDLRLAWQPSDGVEVFVVGRRLLDQEHDELVSDPVSRTAGTQVEREVFVGVVLRF